MSCEDVTYIVIHNGRDTALSVHVDNIDPDTAEVLGNFDLTGHDITGTFTYQPSGAQVAVGIGTGITVESPATGGDFVAELTWAQVSAWEHDQSVTFDFTIWDTGNLPLFNSRVPLQVRAG